jgi:hypothetical protein
MSDDHKSAADAAKAVKDTKAKGKRIVAMLLDESGSMGRIKEATIVGVNEFTAGLKGVKGTRIWMAWFDWQPPHEVLRIKVKGEKPDKVNEITSDDFKPRGKTPLFDAIIEYGAEIDKVVDEDDSVLMVIVTDGKNNKSEASAETCAEAIAERKKEGWRFLYIGANQSAEATAREMGLADAGEAFNYAATDTGVRASMRRSSGLAATFASQGSDVYASASAAMYETRGGRIDDGDEQAEPGRSRSLGKHTTTRGA